MTHDTRRTLVLAAIALSALQCPAAAQLAECALTCSPNITAAANPGQCNPVVNYSPPTTSGSCSVITCTPPSGSAFPVGMTIVTCTDSSGTYCIFTVTVVDSQPPAVACPPADSISAQADSSGQATVPDIRPQTTMSDNCTAANALVVTQDPPAGAKVGVGTTAIIVTARDASGNTEACPYGFSVTRRGCGGGMCGTAAGMPFALGPLLLARRALRRRRSG